jgi:hypothetical protein
VGLNVVEWAQNVSADFDNTGLAVYNELVAPAGNGIACFIPCFNNGPPLPQVPYYYAKVNYQSQLVPETNTQHQVSTASAGIVLQVGLMNLPTPTASAQTGPGASVAPTTTLAEELQALRQAQGQGGAVGVARSDLPGLEGTTSRGASPNAGGPLEAGGTITSPNPSPRFQLHAEQDLVNQIDSAIQGAGLKPEQMVGTNISMHISQRVCPICRQGLPGTEVPPGVLKQLSDKYPSLTFNVTAEGTTEVLRFRGGKYVD